MNQKQQILCKCPNCWRKVEPEIEEIKMGIAYYICPLCDYKIKRAY